MPNRNVETFLRVLDPADNSTGGGAASAIAGAMAAALVAMVAHLSIGKERMEAEVFYRELATEAETLLVKLFNGGREDVQAFGAVREAYSLPKHTDEQRAERRQAIEQAMLQAARVPLANGERCQRVLELCEQLHGRSNPNAASDLKCAIYLARAGLLGCVANVEINLPFIKDEALSTELAVRARELREFAVGDGDRAGAG